MGRMIADKPTEPEPRTCDLEFDVLILCIRELGKLDPEARVRIVNAAAAFFALEIKVEQ